MFTDAGCHEALKGSVHGALLALAGVCLGYNLLAWTRRQEPHLARNVLIYSAIAILEVHQIKRHTL